MMKPNLDAFRALCAAACLLVLTTQCRFLEAPPPFQYLSALLVSGPVADCHRVLGLHYALRNTGGREIRSIRISFSLFDTDGNQVPDTGNNYFDAAYEEPIPPGCDREICTSLDSSFYFRPQVGLVTERFRIYRVEFTDGGTWSDPLALYLYPYDVASMSAEAVEEESP